MAMIEIGEAVVRADAALVADGLGINPSLVQERMREGKSTSLGERGADEDQADPRTR